MKDNTLNCLMKETMLLNYASGLLFVECLSDCNKRNIGM